VYEVIVIDTSPLAVVSDAVPLLKLVDGAIVVGRVGGSRRDVAEQLNDTLVGVEAPLVGVVASNVDVRWPAPRASRNAT
jgi:Mrp family chromosome partitioning ATPase